ncbi:MAG TPA: bestrophin family ion channel [Pirellulales bacterium]|nr:bestrophin family ion channel [Pirellulales bacterium]
MIEYDRQNWLKSVLSFRGTALRQAWGRILAVTAYAIAMEAVFQFAAANGNQNVLAVFTNLPPTIHAVLGTLLGFLIVFRMNASNNRYWEGRSSWGQIINASRNLVRVGVAHTDDGARLANLVSGYVICLRRSLQGSLDMMETEEFLPEDLCRRAEFFGNPPTAVAFAISEWIETEYRQGALDSSLVRHMEDQLSKLIDAQGSCEKIRKTPMPFVYAVMVKQLIMVYLMTLPFAVGDQCGWWTPVVVAMVALGLFGVEEASVEIEDPFGSADNCLDMVTYTVTISRDVGQMAARKKPRQTLVESVEEG